MAIPPTPAADTAAMPDAPLADDAAGADAGAEAQADGEPEETVLLTVCKAPDGTYSLIKGDEQEADGTDLAGSAGVEGSPEEANKQTFDNKGSLLKAVLDILDEDENSEGGKGSSQDQFEAGFAGDDAAPAEGAAPIPQKY